MTIVPVTGLFETHLTVSDLDRSTAFYQDVVGLKLAHRVPERDAAFFWVCGTGKAMLGLRATHASPVRTRLHLAFDVRLNSVIASVDRLRQAGITPRDAGGGNAIAEPQVIGWMPAASVFFDDPDGHSLEYVSMLEDEPHPEWGTLPLSEWRHRTGTPRSHAA